MSTPSTEVATTASAPGALSRFDNILLGGAALGKSAEELSRLVRGTMSPEECLLHVKEILRRRNVWELPERKQLVLHQLQNLADDMQKQYQQSGDRNDAALLLKALSEVSTTLEKQGAITEAELKMVNAAQARVMMSFIIAAYNHARKLLAEEFPDLDIPFERIEAALQEGMAIEAENQSA